MRNIIHTIPGRFIVFLALSLASAAQAQQLPSDLVPIVVADTPHFSPNYYSLQKLSSWPPLPFIWLSESNVQLYASPSLGTNAIFVNDLDTDYVQIAAEALVLRLARHAANNVPPVPGGDDGDSWGDPGGGTSYSGRPYTTNDLYLDLLLTNSTANVTVHTPETSGVYDLFSATSLTLSNTWAWVMRTAPGQTNITVTSLQSGQGYFILGRTNDADSDGLSDAYEALESGTDPQTPDPTAISFSLSLPHDYVNYRMVPATVTVLTGYPTLMAVLVNPTNFDAADWVPLASPVTVDLGTTDGRKQVWVGLRGPLPNIQPAWHGTHVTLATVPPVLVITNPVNLTDSRPMIQLQGYSPTPLASLFFDVTNDAGANVLNQQGFVVHQHYDTNTFAFTTNYFQCFDIALALGSNTITLRATDWAGNTAVTNLTYTFSTNDDTTAPVITLAWPQDGMKITGTSFTLRGRLDDPTATVLAQIVSPDGTTNAVAGL